VIFYSSYSVLVITHQGSDIRLEIPANTFKDGGLHTIEFGVYFSQDVLLECPEITLSNYLKTQEFM